MAAAPLRRSSRRSGSALGSFRLRVFLFIVTLAPASALAHKMPVRRTLFLEPSGDREIQIAARIKVPGGDPRRALNLLADQDHDGELDETELAEVRRTLARRALDGVRLIAGTATVTVEHIETKARVEGAEGPVEVMLHGVGKLPDVHPLRIAVVTSADAEALELVVLPGTRPVLDAGRGKVARGGFTAPTGPGDRVSWRIP